MMCRKSGGAGAAGGGPESRRDAPRGLIFRGLVGTLAGMGKFGIVASLLALVSSYADAQLAPPIAVPPPPIFASYLVDFVPGEVRCGTLTVRPVSAPRAFPANARLTTAITPAPVSLSFRIDASGRALGIGQPTREIGFYLQTDDLAPMLAAWRFAPGAAQGACSLTFTPRLATVAEAPIGEIYRYLSTLAAPMSPAPEVLARIRADRAGDCLVGTAPEPRMRVYPDYGAIAQPPGTTSFAAIGFDVDARGTPARVHVLASDGDPAFDRAALGAVAHSRYAPGARIGCVLHFRRRQPTAIDPPPAPDMAAYRGAGVACDPARAWVLPPAMNFPAAFRRRGIEGWAVIGYDIAPWGATGNLRVLASEPAAAFGEAARAIVAQAKRAAGPTGASGCVERVIFRLAGAHDAPVPVPVVLDGPDF